MRPLVYLILLVYLLSSCNAHKSVSRSSFALGTDSIATTATSTDIIHSFERWMLNHQDSLSIVIEDFDRDTLTRRITITHISHGEESHDSSTDVMHTDTVKSIVRSCSIQSNAEEKDLRVGSNTISIHCILIIVCVMLLGRIMIKKGHS